MKIRLVFIGALLAILSFVVSAGATLIDYGNGLVYDTGLGVTWYDAPAVARNWDASVAWAANLSVTVCQWPEHHRLAAPHRSGWVCCRGI